MINNNKELYLSFRNKIFEVLDAPEIVNMTREQLEQQLHSALSVLTKNYRHTVPTMVRNTLVKNLVDELTGLGPLQPLIEDDSITDIMVNGCSQIYYERLGKIHRSELVFINEQQLFEIAQRIASRVGRRVDESSPMVDARLEDGSRVNIVINPIAIDGTTISIRKFRQQKISFEDLVKYDSLSMSMARVLMIAARCRLNIVIAGGTGSGKTTLLNALSNYIGQDERIITIEDAAELRLQQPHVVRLETRPESVESTGKVTQRDLVINSLRMRPDRIIVGECRGSEAFEMLQAMNTGHDGSMTTLHANSPRDAIARIESMVMMANLNQPLYAIRRGIVSAIHLIVQVNRQRDGSRKIVSIAEVMGLEGDNVVLEELFRFESREGNQQEKVVGEFTSPGIMQRSILMKRAAYYGLQDELAVAFRGI